MHEAYMNGELTTKEFVDWYNDPANYRLESVSYTHLDVYKRQCQGMYAGTCGKNGAAAFLYV